MTIENTKVTKVTNGAATDSHLEKLLAKAREYDKQRESIFIDVTPEGYGPDAK